MDASVLQAIKGQMVVVDLRSPFVCLGKLKSLDDAWLEMSDADLHDLRHTQTSREAYVAESKATGVKRNRKHVLIARREVVAVALLADVVDE
jgi:hypothetical protein